MSDDDERRRGLQFRRGGRSTALVPTDAASGDIVVEQRNADGTGFRSSIPGSDVAIYQEMLDEGARLEDLASQLNMLKTRDPATRKLIRNLRVMAIDLKDEVERRIHG